MRKRISRDGEYSAVYKSFGGIDATGNTENGGRLQLSYAENIYKDYDGDFSGSLESIPGFRKLANFGGRINSVFMQRCSEGEEYVVVHAGTSVYRFNVNNRDAIGTPLAIGTLKNGKSHAFAKGTSLFISDGENLLKISSDGAASAVTPSSDAVYIPTTFKNGEPYEQRSLLTSYFKESLTVSEYDLYFRETDDLEYEIDDKSGFCTVIGVKSNYSGPIYIPKYASFGSKRRRVTGIADMAFKDNTKITAAHIAEGVTSIGKLAFQNCTALTSVQCPSTIEFIDNGAFLDCTALTDAFIGRNLKKVGMLPFSGAYSLENIKFEAEENIVAAVENVSELNTHEHIYLSSKSDIHYRVPIYTPYDRIERVTINGEPLNFGLTLASAWKKASVIFTLPSESIPEGAEIVIHGVASLGKYNSYAEGVDFHSRSGADIKIIAGCTCSAFFDGRIFVAGNPRYPNTVFYSLLGRDNVGDKLYFGSLAYFDDGVSAYEAASLTPTSDALAVLKVQDDGSGGIFYHEAREAGDFLEKVYPVSNIHTGIGVKGKSMAYLDEVFFLSDAGACSLRREWAGQRRAVCRSERINPIFLQNKNLGDASLAFWRGYIAVGLGDEIYLADAGRALSASDGEYDWFRLTGIGTYVGAKLIARYLPFAPSGYRVHSTPGALATGNISKTTIDGYGEFFYVSSWGKKYGVYVSGETSGGTFSPATCIFSDSRLLFFGTESGDLCVFNTDKRGVAPDRISALSDFDPDEYASAMGNRIHPDFYDFDGKRVNYVFSTAPDDLEIPYFKKSVTGRSVSIGLGALGGVSTNTEISADGRFSSRAEGLCGTVADFAEIDFAAFSFDTGKVGHISIRGEPKSFRELEFKISSDEFRSPICISEISYRYKIKGRLTRK